ncbi:MAG TPA: hypothetical protein DCS11_09595 [Syntrophus sp. (in: bacteria)]|nr:hypothetical protein [Syntrophus sp. (in: bacteria)]
MTIREAIYLGDGTAIRWRPNLRAKNAIFILTR